MDALQCYWLELLTRFSKQLSYTPGRKPGLQADWNGRRGKTDMYFIPVREYLDTLTLKHRSDQIQVWMNMFQTDFTHDLR